MKRFKMVYVILFAAVISLLSPLPMPQQSYHVVSAASIKLNKTEKAIYVGNTYRLSLKGTTKNINWKSSNEEIATVSAGGIVTGISKGKAVITATCGKRTYKCTITVKNPSLSDKSLTLKPNVTKEITLKGVNGSLNWKSSNPNVATVDKKGVITALSNGTATISVSYFGEKYSCTVNVEGEAEVVLDSKAIYEKCSQSVVQVNAGDALGSGFFFKENTIVTNYHVIEGAKKLTVVLNDQSEIPVVKILGYSKELDIALLYVNVSKPTLARNTHGITVGETTYAIGSSLGLTSTFSNGMVTNQDRFFDGIHFIQTNTAISHGNSGGPLINVYGEVMGITSNTFTEGQNLNLAIEISQVDQVDTTNPISTEVYLNGGSSTGTTQAQADTETKKIYEDPFMSDEPDTAQKLPESAAAIGSIDSEYDIDFYRIDINKKGSYVMGYLVTDCSTVNVCLVDHDLNHIYWRSTPDQSGEAITDIVQLEKGTYYLAIFPQKGAFILEPTLYCALYNPVEK